jgi:hypothetical protein
MLTVKQQVHLTPRIRMSDAVAARNSHLSRRMRCRLWDDTVMAYVESRFCLDYGTLSVGTHACCITDIETNGLIASLPQTCSLRATCR